MKMIGTCYASARELNLWDAEAAKTRRELSDKANKLFSGLDRRMVEGEERFYYTSRYYAIMGRNGAPKWFRVEQGKTFACDDPRGAGKITAPRKGKNHNG